MNKRLHVPPLLGRHPRTTAGRLLLLLLVFLCGTLRAVAGDGESKSGAWATLKTVDKVTVQYQQVACQQQDLIVLKMINNSDHAVTVSWSLASGGMFKSVNLKVGETKAVECNSPAKELLSQVIPTGKSIHDFNPTFYVK